MTDYITSLFRIPKELSSPDCTPGFQALVNDDKEFKPYAELTMSKEWRKPEGLITKNQIKLMRHTIYHRSNWFATSIDSPDSIEFRKLINIGLAKAEKPKSWMGDDVIYRLTDEGREIAVNQDFCELCKKCSKEDESIYCKQCLEKLEQAAITIALSSH